MRSEFRVILIPEKVEEKKMKKKITNKLKSRIILPQYAFNFQIEFRWNSLMMLICIMENVEVKFPSAHNT